MPNKENMSISKKGLGVETFLRFAVAIVALIFFFNIGKPVAEAFFGSNLEQPFNELAKQINNINVPSKQVQITLEPNTAVIGFSLNANSFKCIGCGSGSATDVTSYFTKPHAKECESKACICLCKKSFKIDKSKSPYEMKCDRMQCISLNKNLVNAIELKQYVEELEKREPGEYSFLKNAKWVGGFLFERHSRGDFVSNALVQGQGNKFVAYVKKENINNVEYLAICPSPQCTTSVQEEKNIPPNICQIMYQCIDDNKLRRVPPDEFRNVYCTYTRPATRQRSLDDCEKVRKCTREKTNTPSSCVQAGLFYELTFSQ